MVAQRKSLYRPGYFEAQKSGNEGGILLNTSLNQNIYLGLSIFVLVAIIAFISFAEYTRRETLVGIVSPLGGMVKVQANNSGYVEKLFVKEGEHVEIMDPLYKIKTERFDGTGIGVKKRILTSIKNQYQLLLERRHQESEKSEFAQQSLTEDISRLDSEINILNYVLTLSYHELELTQKLVNKQKTLLNNKFMSEIEFQKQQLDLLAKESQTQTHKLNLQKLLREKQNLTTKKRNLDINLNLTLKDI
ncbi:secretion protein HlyD, partial [Vibrio sp. 10N.222.49.F1]